MVVLLYLLFLARKEHLNVSLYIALNYRKLIHRSAIGYTTMDYVIAVLGIIFVLEATRMVVNPAMVVFHLYSKFGVDLPFI